MFILLKKVILDFRLRAESEPRPLGSGAVILRALANGFPLPNGRGSDSAGWQKVENRLKTILPFA